MKNIQHKHVLWLCSHSVFHLIMEKIEFSCAAGYLLSLLVVGRLSVKGRVGLGNHEKLLK